MHKHLKYVIVIEDDVGALYNYVCKFIHHCLAMEIAI